MIRLLLYALVSAAVGAVAGYLLAEGLGDGAIAGAVVGASLGVIIAVRRGASSAGVSFELEAAGIHDDNLITVARRNLSRDAYRDSFHLNERERGNRSGRSKKSGRKPQLDVHSNEGTTRESTT